MHKLIALFISAAALVAQAHDTGPTVDLKVLTASAQEGAPTRLLLSLVDKKTGKAVGDADLLLVHERKFHLFGFDQGLGNYLHEHPEPVAGQPGVWAVGYTFAQAGTYRLWAEIQRKTQPDPDHHHHHDGGEIVGTTFVVKGTKTPTVAPTSLPVVLKARAGHSQLRLVDLEHPEADALPLVRDEMQMIGLEFTRDDGKQPKIEKYLGADAHFTITNLAGNRIIHAHPMVMAKKLMLHVTFPDAGDYKIFAQFIDAADAASPLRTVELSVHVDAD